ncbi:hypothetical protein ABTM64_19945, partial [Acinetobacter baumannii]
MGLQLSIDSFGDEYCRYWQRVQFFRPWYADRFITTTGARYGNGGSYVQSFARSLVVIAENTIAEEYIHEAHTLLQVY